MVTKMLRTLPGLLLTVLLPLLLLSGCQTMRETQPVPTASFVDLPKFMGEWYIIANIPTYIEKNSYAAVEKYRLEADGTIATTFTQRKGSFDAPLKENSSRGFVRNTATNAEWGMQFIWPFKAEYLISYVDPAYTQTIIARNKRDYVWIMARTPQLSETDYNALVEKVRAMGYDLSKLRRVPQIKGAAAQ